MRRNISSLILLNQCASAVIAHDDSEADNTAKSRYRNPRYRFTGYTLANGLRIVLAPDASQNRVAVHVSIDAGSKVESREQAGLAILLQRIVLQDLLQLQTRERSETLGILEPFEGSTNQERASYFSEVAAGQLDFILPLLARQMRSPNITQRSIDEQRLAILNECRQLGGTRFGRMQEVLLELIYKDDAHKYGAICSLSSMNHLSPQQAESFAKTYYAPNNTVIAIVGNFNEHDVKQIVAEHFGALKRQRIPFRTDPTGELISLERREIASHSPANAATYISAYLTVPSNHPDWYAMNILADIIGQGEDSRLYTALVTKKLAASVHEGVVESRGRSLFRVGAALLPAVGVEKVESVIEAELARIRDEGVTQTEIERARLQERAYYAEQLGTPAGRASFLARSTLYYNDPTRINTELGFILAVTAQDVQRVARKYLVKTNRAVVIAQPVIAK